MPIKYDIIEDKKLIVAIGTGVVTANDVLNHLDKLAADNKYISPMKKLIDYRTIESISISPDEAREIALKKEKHTDIFSGEKCAFVSPGDLTYGTARVHQSLIDGSDVNTAVFRSIEEAKNWLDIELDIE